MALKEKSKIRSKNPVIASLTIDFLKEGGQNVHLKGVERLTVGRLQKAFPDIFREYHTAMHGKRIELRKLHEQKESA